MIEGRGGFNPCLFHAYVYICGFDSRLVEAFSPQTDIFLPLHLELPDSNCCCLFVHNSFLVVHSYEYIFKFAATGEAGALVLQSQICSQKPVVKYPNSQPVLDTSRCLYFIIQGYKAISLNMETGVEVQSFI